MLRVTESEVLFNPVRAPAAPSTPAIVALSLVWSGIVTVAWTLTLAAATLSAMRHPGS